jgi:hypothetical protein
MHPAMNRAIARIAANATRVEFFMNSRYGSHPINYPIESN